MPGASRRNRQSYDYWPGFVDALSTLLIVIIFLVLVFVLAQFFFAQALSGRDESLRKLNDQIAQLSDVLALERANNADLRLNLGLLTTQLENANKARDEAAAKLGGVLDERDALIAKLNDVTQKLAAGTAQAQKLARDLDEAGKARDANAAKLADATRDRDALSGKLADVSQKLAAETARGQKLARDLDEAAQARDAMNAKLAATVDDRDALNAKLASGAAQAQKLSKDLEDANKVISADREKIALQLKDLEQLRRDIAALQAVRADLEQKLAGLAVAQKDREAEVTAERDRSRELEKRLSTEQERTALAQKDLAARDIRLAELMAKSDATLGDLDKERRIGADARAQVEQLNQQMAALREQLARIGAALEISEQKSKEQEIKIVDLGSRLNAALASKVEELARYRSEFFGRLREVLGDRPDIRIVGDRFVFQSEVLFEPGSADLGEGGKTQIGRLADTLRELGPKIPADLPWILRVDGHTDKVPIHNIQFASNWELSTARAIAVVKYLIEQGIPSDHLAATGFGEYQPLDTKDDEAARRRNRRIELKLTDR